MTHALIVWPEYAELIQVGYKCYEVRSYRPPSSLIGKRIAIYASKKPPKKENIDRINRQIRSLQAGNDAMFYRGPGHVTGSVKGAIVATAKLERCYECTTAQAFEYTKKNHFAPTELFKTPCYWWYLKEVIPCDPVCIDAPRGAVKWFILTEADNALKDKIEKDKLRIKS